MPSLEKLLAWLVSLLVLAALFLPALTVSVPPLIPQHRWSGLDLIQSSLQSPDNAAPDSYGGMVANLASARDLLSIPAARRNPAAAQAGSGMLRAAGWIPFAYLAAAVCALVALLAIALRRRTVLLIAALCGLVASGAALALSLGLSAAAHRQWDRLLARVPRGLRLPGWNDLGGIQAGVCPYIVVLAFLILLILPAPAVASEDKSA